MRQLFFLVKLSSRSLPILSLEISIGASAILTEGYQLPSEKEFTDEVLACASDILGRSSAGGAVLLLRAYPQPCNVTPAYRRRSAHAPAGGPALQLPPRFSSVLTRYIFLLYRLTGYALSIVIKSQPRRAGITGARWHTLL